MENKFRNSSPEKSFHIDEDVEQCGTGDFILSELDNPEEYVVTVETNKKIRNAKKLSRTLPYVSYSEEELIYIPIVFNLMEDSSKGEAYHNGKQYYVEVLEALNSMLAGTFTNGDDSLGTAIANADHGVECRIRYKLPNKLPVNVLSKFNYRVAEQTSTVIDFKTQTEGYPGYARFRYQDSPVLNTLTEEADADYLEAVASLDSYVASLSGTPGEIEAASLQSPEYAEVARTGHIKDLGGLIDCGPEGGIRIFDLSKLKGDRLSAFGYSRGWGSSEHYGREFYGNSEHNPAGALFGNADDYYNGVSATIDSTDGSYVTYWVESFNRYLPHAATPTLAVDNLRGSADFVSDNLKGFSGKAVFPSSPFIELGEMDPHGRIKMNVASEDPIEYARVLLHELGHLTTLSHSFAGGRMFDSYSPTRVGDLTLPFTGDASPLNTLSSTDKAFIEGSLRYARDEMEGVFSANMNYDTYTSDGNVIKLLPTNAAQGPYAYTLVHTNITRRVMTCDLAMFTGIVWGGGLSETLVTPEGNPQLVLNKTTYTTHTEGITGEVPITLSGFENPDTSSGGYGYDALFFDGPTYSAPSGVLNSCVITVHAPEVVYITPRDQNGISLQSGQSLWFGDVYSISIPAENLVGVTSIQLVLTTAATFFIDSMIFNTSEKTIYTPTPALDFVTRIPYCKLDENGNQTDVYDDFWAINGNWLKSEYPEYPPNTSTNEMHNIEYCPCLHAVQFYDNGDGIIQSTSLLEDALLRDIHIASINNVYPKPSYLMVSSLNRGTDYLSDASFSGSEVVSNNGYVPIFGFCGLHMRLKEHTLQGNHVNLYDANGHYIKETYATDRVADVAPQNHRTGSWKFHFMEHLKFIKGSADVASPYYNPYKLNGNDLGEEVLDALGGFLDPTNTSLLEGAEMYGSPINYSTMYECMQYARSFSGPETGDLSEALIGLHHSDDVAYGSMGYRRSCYSPDQISIVEAVVDLGLGMLGRARVYGELIGLGATPSPEDLFTPIFDDIVEMIETEDLSAYIGCTDPLALNYNADAEISSYRNCLYPVTDCSAETAIINICLDTSPLTCSDMLSSEELLEAFIAEGDTESILLSSDIYPTFEGEGCIGGGFKYVVDNSLCTYGSLDIEGCLVGEVPSEDIISSGHEYVLICPDTEVRSSVLPNLYTFGDIYFTFNGDPYVGPYVYRVGELVWAGTMYNTTFRLYTKEQLAFAKINTLDVSVDVIKFFKIKENIENICKFVKL